MDDDEGVSKADRPRSLATFSDPAFTALANHIRSRLFTRHAA